MDDSSNLPPLERDILHVRVAHLWNIVDHAEAEEYLKTALENLKRDAETKTGSKNAEVSDAIGAISSDVMSVDRGLWADLIKRLPPSDASDAISTAAADLVSNDPQGALELERKSLAQGGSGGDLRVLDELIDKNQTLASTLFDEILNTAAKPGVDQGLLTALILVAAIGRQSEGMMGFFSQERRQQIADVISQRILNSRDSDVCDLSLDAEPMMWQYTPAIQGQLLQITDECKRKNPYADTDRAASTDDLVDAMNQTSNIKAEISLRRRAASRAYSDKNYERAIRLCLDATPAEREGVSFPFDQFDNTAVNYAFESIREGLRKSNDSEVHRILNILPARLKASVEINAVRWFVANLDRGRALLMLTDARNILEHEVPVHTSTYFFMLGETVQLAPTEIGTTWRVLGNGLNQFDRAMKQQSKSALLLGGNPPQLVAYINPIIAWPVPDQAVQDENLIRAITEDLESPEFRACLRLSLIERFLTRYFAAVNKPAVAVSAAKN